MNTKLAMIIALLVIAAVIFLLFPEAAAENKTSNEIHKVSSTPKT